MTAVAIYELIITGAGRGTHILHKLLKMNCFIGFGVPTLNSTLRTNISMAAHKTPNLTAYMT